MRAERSCSDCQEEGEYVLFGDLIIEGRESSKGQNRENCVKNKAENVRKIILIKNGFRVEFGVKLKTFDTQIVIFYVSCFMRFFD